MSELEQDKNKALIKIGVVLMLLGAALFFIVNYIYQQNLTNGKTVPATITARSQQTSTYRGRTSTTYRFEVTYEFDGKTYCDAFRSDSDIGNGHEAEVVVNPNTKKVVSKNLFLFKVSIYTMTGGIVLCLGTLVKTTEKSLNKRNWEKMKESGKLNYDVSENDEDILNTNGKALRDFYEKK